MRVNPIARILTLVLSLGLVAPLAAEAQRAGRMPRIGYLTPFPPAVHKPFSDAFLRGLSDLGYAEGQNIVIEWRTADGQFDRLPRLAAELIDLSVDVLVVVTTPGALAAKRGTTTIPIVMADIGDPLVAGLVKSLARPGGNITGISLMAPDLVGKQLQILKEAAPKTSRLAVLWNPSNPNNAAGLKELEPPARILGLSVRAYPFEAPGQAGEVFAKILRERVNALLVMNDGFFWTQMGGITMFAASNRLPAIYALRGYVHGGGLMSFGPDLLDGFRRAATFMDKILKGAKPGDLPVEQPTKFELVINLKTAKALGLTIPESLLLRADQVIE